MIRAGVGRLVRLCRVNREAGQIQRKQLKNCVKEKDNAIC